MTKHINRLQHFFCLLIVAALFSNVQAQTLCTGGSAAGYPCGAIDLMGFVSLNAMGCAEANDIWGWTDPQTGNEYAIFGCTDRTTFIDVTDPVNPIFLGHLISHNNTSSLWRDMKVYADHAYIVSEAGGHGMQVFDLTQLRNITNPPVTFSETAHLGALGNGLTLGNSHNIVINEGSGYAYTVGNGGGLCAGGLTAINLSNPANPAFVACFEQDAYTHDAQCVNYIGPDAQYAGTEICFNSNENTLTIVDVTDKTDMTQISRTGYPGVEYAHQGWLTENHEYFLMNDELDESGNGHNTRTYIWDVRDLDAPVFLGFYEAAVASIDHNLYIKGNLAYMANYRSGLRVVDISDIANGNLLEVGYFDTYTASNSAQFNGAWSNYPYFDSGTIIVSDIEQGLFVLRLSNAAPSCNDGIQNGNETGIDCGGSDCPSCPPTCTDGIQNGNETDIDCGGPDCPSCQTCSDGILNGNEIGIDCGGPDCTSCPAEDCTLYDFTGAVLSYDAGGNDQGTATIQDAGATVLITANGWKAIPINYTITPNTVIEFDFQSTVEGEIHELGFDSDLTFAPTHRYVLYGNQGYAGDYVNQTYTGNGWEHFTIQAGTDFIGVFQYLVLTADDDATGNGNSYFRNLQIYEDYDDNLTCTIDLSCPSILSLTNPVPTGIYSAGVEVNCNTTVDNLSSVKFVAGQVVKLENGFVAPIDTRFEATIGDCQ